MAHTHIHTYIHMYMYTNLMKKSRLLVIFLQVLIDVSYQRN